MELILATVVTNCTEDDFFRVKVKAPGYWEEESCLIPSVNCIYLEVDDTVVVGMTSMQDPIILGKIFNHTQKDNDPVNDKHVLFQAKKGDVWVVGTLTEEAIEITTSDEKKLTITTSDDDSFESKTSLSIQAKGVLIKATDDEVKIEGKVVIPATTSAGSKVFCNLPNCLFSGAAHAVDSTQ